jgi:hypothetical protein
MADVNMTDAPAAPKAKVAKAGAGTEGDKKRFEVKKVRIPTPIPEPVADRAPVERRSALGVGHRGRQLRYLPEPYHGLVH